MDLGVESSAGPLRTMPPAPPHIVDFSERGGVEGVRLAQPPSGSQADFLPVPRFLARARSRRYGAHHTYVGFGNDILLPHRWQNAEGLLILLLEELFGPARMME